MVDLFKVRYKNDKTLEDFMHRWTVTIMNMQDRPDNPHLRDLLLEQIKNSPAMKHSMNIWNDMPEDDPNKSYFWLVKRIEAYVDSQRIEANLLS